MALLDLFQQNAVVFYGVVAFVSLMVGSFLNVVIHRLPIMMERAWREGIEEFEQERAAMEAAKSGDRLASDAGATAETADSATSASNGVAGGTDLSQPENARQPEPFNLAVPRSRCPSMSLIHI